MHIICTLPVCCLALWCTYMYHTQLAVCSVWLTSGQCVLAGREDFLPEDSLWLQEPQRWFLLLPRVWHPGHQPVPWPDGAQALPQRGQLDLQLPAVPMPGMSEAFLEGATVTQVMMFSEANLETGSGVPLHLLFRLGMMMRHFRELKAAQSVFLLLNK